jgi:hypothetical protein
VFADEVRSFHVRLMQAMDERIRQVINGGLPKTGAVDLGMLVQEHVQRNRTIERALAGPPVPTDWERVRSAIAAIAREMLGRKASQK